MPNQVFPQSRSIKATQQKRVPAFVTVYEVLYNELCSGKYPPGSQLPGELALAETYGVSRNTLRQALLIFQEDGIIQNIQGKGNFVNENFEGFANGIERLSNPLLEFCKNECDRVEIEYYFDPPPGIVKQKLQLDDNELVMTANSIYYCKEKPVGFAYYAFPLKVLQQAGLNLAERQTIEEFIINGVFKMAAVAQTRLKVTYAIEYMPVSITEQPDAPILFMEEVLFNPASGPIALCKHYFNPDEYNIHFSRKH